MHRKAILPTNETGIEVRVVAVGTGQALKIGERGDCDVVFVHDRPAELAFVGKGFGVDRHEVMYNDFILVGPKSDPAHVDGGIDIVAALRKIEGKPVGTRVRLIESRPFCRDSRVEAGIRVKSETRFTGSEAAYLIKIDRPASTRQSSEYGLGWPDDRIIATALIHAR